MRILVTPTFVRAVKKMHHNTKKLLDDAVRVIASQPDVGELKVGDLAGIRVYKFRVDNRQCLLAYRQIDESTLTLLMVGPHENFYRDLKRNS